MGLTDAFIVALAGNPNTGKSTIFNSLTGLKQHTGNWPGKTVVSAEGRYSYKQANHLVVDLPGSYSLYADSAEEEIARNFILQASPDCTVVVVDATCLERNLYLALQVLALTRRAVVCVNLIDEAKRKGIVVEVKELERQLGVPVIGTAARSGVGLEKLKDAVLSVAQQELETNPLQVRYDERLEHALALTGDLPRFSALDLLCREPSADGEASPVALARSYLWEKGIGPADCRNLVAEGTVKCAEAIAAAVVTEHRTAPHATDRKLDRILTSRLFGLPIMLTLLGAVFWLTIAGANVPGELIATGLFWVETQFSLWMTALGAPAWLYGLLVTGVYRTLAWVVSVMLPPMAIFFPLFTLLEDLGYLPRVAFNLDALFKKAGAHGKQALTMCMGFGCNAAGVISARIIESPRERLIATITNNFVPCNGRFPILIAVSAMFLAADNGAFASVTAALAVLLSVVLGVGITLAVSKLLSVTVLKGLPSSFTLELPPYRLPQIGKVIVRSLLDRTLFVLARAVMVAAPAGVVIWAMANITVGDASLLNLTAGALDPLGRLMGLDGFILMAFILGLPANEIVIPILIMSYLRATTMLELDSLDALRQLFVANGWTWLTAVCTMLFALNHFPCGTTLLTIRKETLSSKWTWLSFLVPTVTGIVVCVIVAQGARMLGIV
ncbi:MAG: ferrous iron transport protein B [Selenomonadales bacterium]|nr:ferrous iron transport protein B [Selenomonadales bacterium]